MIGYLKGRVAFKKEGYLMVLTSGGVGYKVSVPFGTFGRAAEGGEVELHTYLQVREDILALYGFDSIEELALFEKVISVSGIGPKAGLSVLSALGKEKLFEAIESGRAEVIVGVPGVGKKTAERLVLELAGKLEKIESPAVQDETYDALVSLGYSAKEAEEVVKKIDKNISGTQERVKEALRLIRK